MSNSHATLNTINARREFLRFLAASPVASSAMHGLDPKERHLYLKNPQTLYGVESAALAPGYKGN